jgi:hypothetical protein
MGIRDWLSSRRTKDTEDGKPALGKSLNIYASQPGISVVMITIIGVNEAQIDEIIDVTQAKFGRGNRLVYLTDSLDFMKFRNRGVIFEYVPSSLEQRLHSATMPWPSYLEEHWLLLLAKWKPLHILTYGQNIGAFLASAPAHAPDTNLAD